MTNFTLFDSCIKYTKSTVQNVSKTHLKTYFTYCKIMTDVSLLTFDDTMSYRGVQGAFTVSMLWWRTYALYLSDIIHCTGHTTTTIPSKTFNTLMKYHCELVMFMACSVKNPVTRPWKQNKTAAAAAAADDDDEGADDGLTACCDVITQSRHFTAWRPLSQWHIHADTQTHRQTRRNKQTKKKRV